MSLVRIGTRTRLDDRGRTARGGAIIVVGIAAGVCGKRSPDGWTSSRNNMLADFLATNPFFSAGAGLVGLTASLAMLRTATMQSAVLLRRRLTVSLELPSRDRSYAWLMRYMHRIPSHAHTLAIDTSADHVATMVPGPGRRWFKYNGAWIVLDRQRDGKIMDMSTGVPFETITLTTLTRDKHVLLDLISDAKKEAMKAVQGRTIIYTSRGPDWRPFGLPRKKRPLESVVLAGDTSQRIVQDVHTFLASEQWYTDRGIPYRRGYLLYGVPGTGKTSFVQSLAGELDYGICVLNLAERGLTDDRLMHLLVHAPEKTLILLEDIDAAFSKPDAHLSTEGFRENVGGSLVTFSGLLNALDGVASAEERILFMTTNHPERLDPALIRPGRADVRVQIGYATSEQIRRMFLRFYPDQVQLANAFTEKVGERKVTAAALQGLFVWAKNNPKLAIDSLEQAFFKSPVA